MSGAEGWMHGLAIAAGGALGAVLRGLLARLASRPGATGSGPRWDPALATLAANLAACALLGGWTSIATGRDPSVGGADPTGPLAAFVAIGVCGSLSTFSTLCADLDRLLRGAPGQPSWPRAAAYLLAHLVGGPLALAAGAFLAG